MLMMIGHLGVTNMWKFDMMGVVSMYDHILKYASCNKLIDWLIFYFVCTVHKTGDKVLFIGMSFASIKNLGPGSTICDCKCLQCWQASCASKKALLDLGSTTWCHAVEWGVSRLESTWVESCFIFNGYAEQKFQRQWKLLLTTNMS